MAEIKVVNHDTVSANSGPEMKGKSIRLFGCDVHLSEIQGCMKESSTNERDTNSSDSNAADQLLLLEEDEKREGNSKYYRCKFCDRLYTSSQALGGHQNAHKQERMFRKKLQHEARKASIDGYLRSLQSSMFMSNKCEADDGFVSSSSVEESDMGFNPMYFQSYKYDSLVWDSCGLQVHVPY